jgi:long-chain fatty acid transport protein
VFDKSKINRTDVTATGSTVNLRGDVEGSAVVLSTGARFSF